MTKTIFKEYCTSIALIMLNKTTADIFFSLVHYIQCS